jgi:predicted alpha/beta hydrolase
MSKKSFEIVTAGGQRLAVYAWEPVPGAAGQNRADGDSGPTAGTSILILPAMGAPARAYVKVASYFRNAGYAVFALDLRGSGASGPPPSRANDFGYTQFLKEDWPAFVSAVRERRPHDAIVLFGHSLGGQVSAMYAGYDPASIDALVLITTLTPHYIRYDGRRRYGFLFYFWFAGWLARLLGYFPGHRVGFGGLNARSVILEWARVGRTGHFRTVAGEDLDGYFARVRCPVAAVSFVDDAIGSEAAARAMLANLPQERLTHWHISPTGEESIGHFGWMSRPQVLEPVRQWLLTHAPGRRVPV